MAHIERSFRNELSRAVTPASRGPSDPIPITVVGGYLGAGKTTFLNHLLRNCGKRSLAVVMNDFGSVDLDSMLISRRRAQIISLNRGCICCARQTEFVMTLARLRSRVAPLDHVLVEASGISDPARIAEYADLYGLRLEAIICVADAEAVRVHAASPFSGHRVREQLTAADVLVFNKVDLVSEREKQSVRDWLSEVAPAARIVEATYGRIPASLVLDWSGERSTALDRVRDLEPTRFTGGGAEVDREYTSWSWSREQGLDPGAFRWWVASLPQALLRGKGVLHFGDDARHRYVFHLAGRRWSLDIDDGWQGGPARSRLVLIGPCGSFDPALLDVTIAQCTMGRPSPTTSALA
jgi:G3E family GTPase